MPLQALDRQFLFRRKVLHAVKHKRLFSLLSQLCPDGGPALPHPAQPPLLLVNRIERVQPRSHAAGYRPVNTVTHQTCRRDFRTTKGPASEATERSQRVIGGVLRASEKAYAAAPHPPFLSRWRTVRRPCPVWHGGFGARQTPMPRSER